MARHFVPITPEELKKKIEEQFSNAGGVIYQKSVAHDDIAKVQFDGENWDDDSTHGLFAEVLGTRTLPNGLTYHGVSAGGDWEFPVFFILYFDGKNIRGYVPKDGNTWNYKTKSAFGNEDDDGDEDDYIDAAEAQYDAAKIIADIQKRITPKEPSKAKKLKPDTVDTVIAKATLSSFTDLELFEELKRRGIKQW